MHRFRQLCEGDTCCIDAIQQAARSSLKRLIPCINDTKNLEYATHTLRICCLTSLLAKVEQLALSLQRANIHQRIDSSETYCSLDSHIS
jgi:hypothetical protein